MKKRWFILCLVFISIAMLYSLPVSIQTARQAANHWLSCKSNEQFTIDTSVTQSLDGQPCFYVFPLTMRNRESQKGFILVSSTNSYQPIIGYSFDSPWDNDFSDAARTEFFNSIKYSIRENESRSVPDEAVTRQWTDLLQGSYDSFRDDRDVAALVTTRWNQSPLYNNQCPTINNALCPVGCTAVSMAQVIRYYAYPPQGNGYHSYIWHDQELSANFGQTTYDWSNMPNTLAGASANQINVTSQFLYQVGVSVNMDYGSDGSASWYSPYAFNYYFQYPNSIQLTTKTGMGTDAWKNLLRFELDHARPMPYGNAYHAFVCDGYQGTDFFHFNMGWGGSNDGFYLLTALTPSGYQFSFGQNAIIGIHSPGLQFPAQLSCSTSGNNINLQWTGVSDPQCLGYKLYMNGLYYAQTTQTFYSFTNASPETRKSVFVTAYYSSGESVSSNIAFIDPVVLSRFERRSDISICTDGGTSEGAAWIDIDNDNDLDLVVANYSEPNFLYLNNGNGDFTRITEGALANDNRTTEGLTCGDYNNDGYIDVFMATLRDKNLMFRNDENGNFNLLLNSPVSANDTNCRGVCFGDYDNDGWLDLFAGPNYLFHNNAQGDFTLVTSGPIFGNSGNASTATWVDFNNDGLIDLHVFDETTGYHHLYQNLGEGQFTIFNDPVFNAQYTNSRGASWGDYDNDGFDDVVITREDGYSNILLHNNGNGSFTRVTNDPVVTSSGNGRGSAWADLDNDGDLDLIIVNFGEPNLLFYNDGSGHFTQDTTDIMGQDSWMSSAVAVADYNRDGKLDVFITNELNQNNMLYDNVDPAGNYLTIKCTGRVSNTQAIGTIIWVKANVNGTPRWQKRTVMSQTGHETMNTVEQHFGLGQATVADSIIVYWPNGIVQTLTNVTANQYLVINETGYILHATISSDITTSNVGQEIQFHSMVQSFPSPVSLYQWCFDYHGTFTEDSNLPNPTWIYNEPGYHTVRLIVLNDDQSYTVTREELIYTNYFAPVATEALTQGSNFTGVSCPDLNNDGYPDLYLSCAVTQFNHCLLNHGNFDFTQENSLGLTTGNYNAISSTWGDINNDGIIDGYVADRGTHPDQFFMGVPGENWMTDPITETLFPYHENSMSSSFVDFNNDGKLDLFVAIGNGSVHRLWMNTTTDTYNPSFTEMTGTLFESAGSNANTAIWADLNNDGLQDCFIANNGTNSLYRNPGSGQFSQITSGDIVSLNSNSLSASAGDYDNDGDLDLLVTNSNNATLLYRNNGNFSFTQLQTMTFGTQSYLQ
ncbi:MAG TPA: FG-GAP-like repeat-containing protein, partial [Candidatus Cloacimonadota bacterium]|nr:FG-GAP-like repeat-containing protein [Candidatus Cloacimonadota bacterium]